MQFSFLGPHPALELIKIYLSTQDFLQRGSEGL